MINFICVSCSCLPIILHSINIAEIENKSIETLWKDCTCILIGVLIMFFSIWCLLHVKPKMVKESFSNIRKQIMITILSILAQGLGFIKIAAPQTKSNSTILSALTAINIATNIASATQITTSSQITTVITVTIEFITTTINSINYT